MSDAVDRRECRGGAVRLWGRRSRCRHAASLSLRGDATQAERDQSSARVASAGGFQTAVPAKAAARL